MLQNDAATPIARLNMGVVWLPIQRPVGQLAAARPMQLAPILPEYLRIEVRGHDLLVAAFTSHFERVDPRERPQTNGLHAQPTGDNPLRFAPS
jgi:hypothetical protein